MKRSLGPVRRPGTRDGLTRLQAERVLQHQITAMKVAPLVQSVTLEDAGNRYIDHLEAVGRKRSTLMDYRSYMRVHLVPHFGERSIEKITPEHVEAFMRAKAREGRTPKSVLNYLGLLHGVLAYAERKGWTSRNVAKLVDKPVVESDERIRFLDEREFEALLDAVPDTVLGRVDRVMYLTAAMTGLRQGELLALRWQDIDFAASRVRVRENYVRGEFGTPKSKRSSRSVPLASRVAHELRQLYMRSGYKADSDLVFCHPETGGPMERSRLLKRYKKAVKLANVTPVCFHDLRRTFGTRMAAAGVAMRTLQEWMGHRDFKTTLIYADYAPSEHETELVERAFRSRAG